MPIFIKPILMLLVLLPIHVLAGETIPHFNLPISYHCNTNIIYTYSSFMTLNKADSAIAPGMNQDLLQLSQDFVYAAKTGDGTDEYVRYLRSVSIDSLSATVNDDQHKLAFWINLYNAYTQVLLQQDATRYKKRSKFFGQRQLVIAGQKFSLDDIEHGILRRSKIKWSLGYLNKLFPRSIEKKLRVQRLDYRLHFALNCGAKSCPPIAYYDPQKIDQQLAIAEKSYLNAEVEYNADVNVVELPTILSWFRRDFGGKKKMIAILQRLNIIPEKLKPKIKFSKYDWTLFLKNYN